jgi:putative transposase
MNQKKIQILAEELAKDLKTPEDLSTFSAQLTTITDEAELMSAYGPIADIKLAC